SSVREMLAAHPQWDGLACSVTGNPHWSRKAGPITRYRVWWQGVDFTMFFRKRMVDAVGLLDERLGPGSGTPWGAGECPDYLLRCLSGGYFVWYEPALKVEHPGEIDNEHQMQKEIGKARTYSVGVGHVLQQHHYPTWFKGY